jgi:hypothetical protein
MNAFVEAIGLTRFALYEFDYGAPTGLRSGVFDGFSPPFSYCWL